MEGELESAKQTAVTLWEFDEGIERMLRSVSEVLIMLRYSLEDLSTFLSF